MWTTQCLSGIYIYIYIYLSAISLYTTVCASPWASRLVGLPYCFQESLGAEWELGALAAGRARLLVRSCARSWGLEKAVAEPLKRVQKTGAARRLSKIFLMLFDDFWRFCPARKLSKSVENIFDTFWRFLIFCPARKMSTSVENIFDTFWRILTFFDVAPFRWPLLRSADCGCPKFSSGKVFGTTTLEMIFLSTPNMTGRRFHCAMEVIPRHPWKSKSAFASSRPTQTSITRGRERCAWGTTRHFLHPLPSCGSPGRPVISVPNSGIVKCYSCQGLGIFRGWQWLQEDWPGTRELLDFLFGDRQSLLEFFWIRKILVSVNFFARNSGAGNGCANFMVARKNCVLSAGKPPCP